MPPSTSNNDTPLTINSIITPPNTKIPIPRLGFGLWQLPGEAALAPTRAALKAGYRHLDSAQLYRNEAQVGEVLRTMAPLRREDVFVTTKQGVRGKTKEETYEMARESVRKISGHEDGDEGYVDLFLVHTPRGGYETRKEIWVDALERLHAEGRARLIGVSNYGVEELEEMKAYATVWPPHVNQIELNPWSSQNPKTQNTITYCQTHGIVLQAYSPLATGSTTKLSDPSLASIAKKHSKSPAQVLIRYGLQKGWVVLPKSQTGERIVENADVFDGGFELDGGDMEILDGLDCLDEEGEEEEE